MTTEAEASGGAADAIPHHYQETDHTCGPAALKMVLEHLWGIRVAEESLAARLGTDDFIGTRQRVLVRFIEELGLQGQERHTDTTIADLERLLDDGYVVMVCYYLEEEATDHYAVVQAVTRDHMVLQDPWLGPGTTLAREMFDAHWYSDPKVPARRDRWLLAIRARSP